MRGLFNINMPVTCKTSEVLDALRRNREQHADLVQEAREGYLKKAEGKLRERLGAILNGKVTDLTFRLSVPRDHTDIYDNAIAMLEMHTGDTIQLSADEFQQLVRDKWEWAREFVATNAAYSSKTAALLNE